MFKVKQGEYESSFSELETEEELVITGPAQKKQTSEDVQAASKDFLAGSYKLAVANLFEEGDEASDSSVADQTTHSRLHRAKDVASSGLAVKSFVGGSVSAERAEEETPPAPAESSGGVCGDAGARRTWPHQHPFLATVPPNIIRRFHLESQEYLRLILVALPTFPALLS